MRVRLFLDIGHVMTKIDWEGKCTLSRRACTRLGLKYGDLQKGKTCDRGTSCRYLLRTENAVYFILS